jgi:hypothetical protein
MWIWLNGSLLVSHMKRVLWSWDAQNVLRHQHMRLTGEQWRWSPTWGTAQPGTTIDNPIAQALGYLCYTGCHARAGWKHDHI